MDDRPPLLIVGTGAMACLFGIRLAPHARVTLLGTWKAGVEAIQREGIRCRNGEGVDAVRVQATCDPRDCQGAAMALVLVKSWQTERAASQLAECLAPSGLALTLQNGLGNLETLQRGVGEGRAALGVTTTGATLLEPGLVRPGGSGPTHLGPHPRIEPLGRLLRSAGFEVQDEEDVEGLLWGKLAINAGINPLTGLLEVPNGALLEDSHACQLMRAAAQEAAAVAEAKGISLPYSDAGERAEQVARMTASNHSSMLQDIRRRAPTEIDAISGAVFREGERIGIRAPVNWTLWNLIRAKVRAAHE